MTTHYPAAGTRSAAWNFTVLLASLLLLLFVLMPFANGWPDQAFTLLLTAILLVAVFTVSRDRRIMVKALVLACPPLILAWSSPSFDILFGSSILVFLGYITWVLLRSVFTWERVTLHVLSGAFCVYLMIAMMWAIAFLIIFALDHNAFDLGSVGGTDLTDPFGVTAFNQMMYFSLATLTTTGYGDISPLSPAARSFSMLESIVNQFFLVVIVASLVSRFVAQLLSTEGADKK